MGRRADRAGWRADGEQPAGEHDASRSADYQRVGRTGPSGQHTRVSVDEDLPLRPIINIRADRRAAHEMTVVERVCDEVAGGATDDVQRRIGGIEGDLSDVERRLDRRTQQRSAVRVVDRDQRPIVAWSGIGDLGDELPSALAVNRE